MPIVTIFLIQANLIRFLAKANMIIFFMQANVITFLDAGLCDDAWGVSLHVGLPHLLVCGYVRMIIVHLILSLYIR